MSNGETGERIADLDLTVRSDVNNLIAELQPDEIYHLAAHHGSSEDTSGDKGRLFGHSFAVHTLALVALFEGMKLSRHGGRLLFASSSLVFGNPPETPQSENTPMIPICPYGISKAAGMQVCNYYRLQNSTFAASAILYNHESPRRKDTFVSRKIVKSALAIKRGERDNLVLGDLGARVDWGYAPDYTHAMRRILSLDEPGDFIVASGRSRTVGQFAACVFDLLNLNSGEFLVEDKSLVTRERRTNDLIGNPRKLAAAGGWRSSFSLEDIARKMVEAECAIHEICKS